MRTNLLIASVVIGMSLTATTVALADDWTRFRGPNGTGIAPALDVPNEWKESDYDWKVDLVGTGHGSPVVKGNLVYLTSGNTSANTVHLEAYDVLSGKRAWHKSIGVDSYRMHGLNSLASTTPAVDDQHVYATFYTPGNVMLIAYTHAGDEVWRVDLGEFTCQHGFSASPVVVGNVVCLQGDNSQQGYLVALDCKTGDEVWRASRTVSKEAYSTPATLPLSNGRTAIVFSSTSAGITAVDSETGKQLWQQDDAMPERTVSSPIIAGDLVLAACGSGGNGRQMVALRAKADGSMEPAYKLTQQVPYVPTGIVVDDLLYLWHERGTISCFEAATGDKLWTNRVGGKYYCSPVLLGDRLLCVSMEGDAVMLASGREYNVLGHTDLGEGTEATPAVAGGRLFLRTASKLMCLSE